jgi:ribonuclease HII
MLKSYFDALLLEAGLDEAGRGCLAGPVVAAAVILPKDFYHPLLNDSKKLSAKHREELRPIIEEKALAWAVAEASPAEIDQFNILKASFLAMHRAVAKLTAVPELLLVDGNRFTPYNFIAHRCVVRGDSTYSSIAAASILAKTYRDSYMTHLAQEYPQYGWEKNAAYPTKDHRHAIEQFGACPHHRKSFKLLATPL